MKNLLNSFSLPCNVNKELPALQGRICSVDKMVDLSKAKLLFSIVSTANFGAGDCAFSEPIQEEYYLTCHGNYVVVTRSRRMCRSEDAPQITKITKKDVDFKYRQAVRYPREVHLLADINYGEKLDPLEEL